MDVTERMAKRVAMPAFRAGFNRALTFGGPAEKRPFVLTGGNLAGFQALYKAQVTAAQRLGRRVNRLTFTPHMTLLYDTKRIVEQSVEPIEWTVHEFVLIHSHVGQHRYDILGRWRLAA